MPAPERSQNIQEVQLKVVGGNKFGRYPKISVEQTWNFIVSDNALVPYAGYKNVLNVGGTNVGRDIFSSIPGNLMLGVWGSQVFVISTALVATFVGSLTTTTGDVFIEENNNQEIAITDGVHIYVYNWGSGLFSTSDVTPGFTLPVGLDNPGYISFQNGRLIVVDTDSSNWYLGKFNDALTWTGTGTYIGALQSKPDRVQAAVPTPGGGNNLCLFGHAVVEQWQDIGAATFPYQRSSTFNVDFGCLNASSIAALDTYIVWLSASETSGATVMIINGSNAKSISTDGLDFKLAELTNPTNCTGFLFRQDGHVIYQFCFPDDNLSYALDLNTNLFFTVTDERLNYHPARNVVFFNDNYYFVSLKNPNLFLFDTTITDIDYGNDEVFELPRLRIAPPLRLPSQRMYIIKSLGFTIENGQPNIPTTITTFTGMLDDLATEDSFDITTEDGDLIALDGGADSSNTSIYYSEAVDLSISRDGGESWGNAERQYMNPIGKRTSRFIFQRLGQANDASPQLRFSGFGRFVAFDGVVEVYV